MRDELIELLKERVRLHKDKFISPTIYEELRGMEVKKNGKVEHSDLTHDDQVFSYLMAIYVWYEGKNLRELFGIDKGPIKTEESVDDIVSLDSAEKFGDITQQLVALTKEGQDRIDRQMAEMQRAKGILLGDFVNKERKREEQNLKLLLQNPIVREAYARKYGMPADSVSIDTDVDTMAGRFYKVPDSLFFDFNKDESEMSRDSIYHSLNMKNLYSGNLEDNGLQ